MEKDPREHNESEDEEDQEEEPTIIEIPENFKSIIYDFTNDLTVTFPEYSYLWQKWTDPYIPEEEIKELFEYVLKVYPERFFDILYQNEDIFKPENDTNTLFLPNVEFKMLFNCKDLSETTQNALWKYLQVILFSITNSIKNKSIFGNTSAMFDGIEAEELQNKLQETMVSIGEFFENLQSKLDEKDDSQEETNVNDESPPQENDFEKFSETAEKMFENIPGMDSFKKTFDFKNMSKNMPNPEELNDHLKGLFDGKIGKIAKEMAEEITQDLNGILGEDYSDVKTTQDVFKKLIKNPKKMIDLVKNIGGKLEKKMKSGELNQEEIMKEATDIFGKMKGMGGEDGNFNEIIKNLMKNMGGLGKNAKFNKGAMNTMMKKQSYMEKMKMKLEKKKELLALVNAQQQLQQSQQCLALTNESSIENDSKNYVFSIPNDKQQKSYINKKSSSTENEKSIQELMNDLNLKDETLESNTPKKSKKPKKTKK
jgi:hypothetical protein